MEDIASIIQTFAFYLVQLFNYIRSFFDSFLKKDDEGSADEETSSESE